MRCPSWKSWRTRGLVSVCVALQTAVGVQVVATTASAGGLASCSQSGATLTVNGNGGDVIVTRTVAGDLQFDFQNCGTVTTVDTVNISGLPTSNGQGVILDMTNGLFAPGATP